VVGGTVAVMVQKRLRDLSFEVWLPAVQRLLLAAAGGTPATDMPRAARPRLGGIFFLHRFDSALNRRVHLHVCVTDGVFVPAAAASAGDAPPAFISARLITPADLAALTERVRRRVIPGIGITVSSRRITRSGRPSRRWRSGTLASSAMP